MLQKHWCVGAALLALSGLCVPVYGDGTLELSQDDLQHWAQAKSKMTYDDFLGLNPIQRGMAARLASGAKISADRALCFWGPVPESLMALVNENYLGGDPEKFQPIGSRWTTTATDGGGLVDGDAITLTYSFVPDGTTILEDPTLLNGDQPSNLFSTFNAIYGTTAAWQAEFAQVFSEWSAVTGITYVFEPNDDGAAMPESGVSNGTPGAIGVRGDLRVCGVTVDGAGAGILAFNFFPNSGDMVIDTANGVDFYNDMSNDSLGLRNVAAHEHGHGLGFNHVCPMDETKLMEPIITDQFDGPQPDDILIGQKHYGDGNNGNNSSGNATPIGSANNATASENGVSLASGAEADFYSFTVTSSQAITVTVTPTGGSYLSGAQNMNGSCSAGTTFNAMAQQNLNVEIRDTNGTTVLATGNSAAAGAAEFANANVTSGTYFVRVFSSSGTEVQGYNLSVTGAGAAGPTLSNESGGGFIEVDDVTAILSVDVSGATPPVTMQWFKNNNGLTNGGNLAGADTDTLTISPLALSDTGVYFLRVTDAAKAVVDSDPIVLTVATELPVGGIVGLGILASGLVAAGVAYRSRRRS